MFFSLIDWVALHKLLWTKTIHNLAIVHRGRDGLISCLRANKHTHRSVQKSDVIMHLICLDHKRSLLPLLKVTCFPYSNHSCDSNRSVYNASRKKPLCCKQANLILHLISMCMTYRFMHSHKLAPQWKMFIATGIFLQWRVSLCLHASAFTLTLSWWLSRAAGAYGFLEAK